MQYRADSLGFSGSVTTILRDLIHERLGLMYEPHQFDQVADRLAPLLVARGVGSFIDYYYLLKYSTDAGRVVSTSWTRWRSTRPTSGGRSISCARSSRASCRSWRAR